MRVIIRTFAAVCMLALLASAPAFAQRTPATRKPPRPPKDRGFLSFGAGVGAAPGALTDTFTYQVNVETATTEARYKRKASVLFDAGIGLHIWKKKAGISVAYSRASSSSTADTMSVIPHPFFDDHDREVTGEAGGLTRTETAVHVDLYYLRKAGKWRVMLMAGPSRLSLEQETITAVTVDETYPYDTATFRGVTTKRGTGTAVGFNVGADIGRTLSKSVAAGLLVRYTNGNVPLNVEGRNDVSTDVAHVGATAGIRIKF